MPNPPHNMNLEDRLKATVGRSRLGSLTPEQPEPPPVKTEERIPDLREVIASPVERLKMARLVEQIGELNEQERKIKAAKKPLVLAAKKLAGQHQIGKAQVGEYRLSYYNSPRTRLDEFTLMKNGVSPKVIANSKITKDSYSLKITKQGEDEGEEEEE